MFVDSICSKLSTTILTRNKTANFSVLVWLLICIGIAAPRVCCSFVMIALVRIGWLGLVPIWLSSVDCWLVCNIFALHWAVFNLLLFRAERVFFVKRHLRLVLVLARRRSRFFVDDAMHVETVTLFFVQTSNWLSFLRHILWSTLVVILGLWQIFLGWVACRIEYFPVVLIVPFVRLLLNIKLLIGPWRFRDVLELLWVRLLSPIWVLTARVKVLLGCCLLVSVCLNFFLK